MQKLKKRLPLIIILAVIVVIIGFCVWYVNDYYHVKDSDSALASTSSVNVIKTDFGYFFDGEGEDTALIFYPGAKVEDIAYADLLKRLAAEGADCFLIHMPCNLAFFGINKADEVMSLYDYENWYLAGHSLGGAMAASYAVKNSEKLNGLVFLAAYSTEDLSDSGLDILLLYGSKDEVVNRDKIEQGRQLMPDTYEEFIIDGGNHAGFGDYGEQSGDGNAKIFPEEQRESTAAEILKMIKAED